MDLIYTNTDKDDVGVLQDFSLDLAFGSDENDFAITVSQDNHVAEAGCFIYIQGTEYGGMIDAVTSDTGAKKVTYSGRTWHGLLNSKILEPDASQDYLIVNGEANAVIAGLLTRMGLTTLFVADYTVSEITIDSYQFDLYTPGYDGILKMLASVGAKLHMEHNGTNVVLSATSIVDHSQNGIDDDQMSLTVKQTKNKVNHLICLGSGELASRTVVHLYADENGQISQKQTFTGINEYATTYEYSNSESKDDLIEWGTKRFEELLQQDDLAVDFSETDDIYDIGDIVGATDNVTGVSVAVSVTKKIVKFDGNNIIVNIETQ